MEYYDSYSQLKNEIFYNEKQETEESILNKVNDSKVIRVLHELYVCTNFRRVAITTLDYLIESCGYKVNQKSQKSFKEILNKLRELKIIDFKDDITSADMLEINTEELTCNVSNFTQLADSEIKILETNITDTRSRANMLKLYLYLKARTFKRTNKDNGEKYGIEIEFMPQTTYQTYEWIEKYTNISQSNIKRYIDKLQELNLITYKSIGKKYNSKDVKQVLTECPNIYAINNLQEDVQEELELGIKRVKHNLRDKGFVIVDKDYKNNDRKINGRKGYLIKKQNNGTITKEESIELDNIIQDKINYQEEYINKNSNEREENDDTWKESIGF
jgi:hypothetical protein